MSDDDWDKEDFVPPPVVTAPAGKEADKPKESWEGKDVPVDDAKEKALEKADAEAAAGVYAGMTKEELIEELTKRDRDINSAKKLAAQQSNRERQRLEKEREKQEQARAALQRASEVPLTAEEQYAKKLADQQKAEESDLAAAMDLFGGLDDGPAKPAAKPAAKAAPAAAAPKGPVTLIEAMEPKTQLEFEKMREAIVKKITKYQEVNFYPMFSQNLVKSICEGLKVEDSRKIVTVVNNVINEKVAAEKAKTKKPNKKNLPSLGNKAKLRDDDEDDMFGDLEDEVERKQELERIKMEKKMKNRELETGPE